MSIKASHPSATTLAFSGGTLAIRAYAKLAASLAMSPMPIRAVIERLVVDGALKARPPSRALVGDIESAADYILSLGRLP